MLALIVLVTTLSLLVACATVLSQRSRIRVRRGAYRRLLQTTMDGASAGLLGGARARLRTRGRSRPAENVLAEELAISALLAEVAEAQWHSIDPHIFEAFSQMTHENVASFWDLSRVVNAHHYQILTSHFINQVAGHVAEFHARADLVSAGAAVAMPAQNNFPGLDLTADGMPFNVKDYGNISSELHTHFAHHPGIGMLVNGDAVGIPHDALFFDPHSHLSAAALASHPVLADAALHHGAIVAATEHAMHLVDHPVHLSHIPIATAVISIIREGRLVYRGHTGVTRAAENVGTDVAIRGGAGVLGAKVGGVLGLAGGPVGVAVGAAAGGFAGGIIGGQRAKKVRGRHLTSARAAYREAETWFQVRAEEFSRNATWEWEQLRASEQRALLTYATAVTQRMESDTQFLEREMAATTRLSGEEVVALIRALRLQMDAQLAQRDEEIAQAGALRAIPLRLRRRLLRADRDAWVASARQISSPTDTALVFDHMLALPAGRVFVAEYIQRVQHKREATVAQLGRTSRAALDEAIQARLTVMARLRTAAEGIAARAREALAPEFERLTTASEAVLQEMRKAGHSTGSTALPAPRGATPA